MGDGLWACYDLAEMSKRTGRLAIRSGLVAGVGVLCGIGVLAYATKQAQLFYIGIGIAVVVSVLVYVITDKMVTQRVRKVLDFLTDNDNASLKRLPNLGDDEVGQVASNINSLFTSMTSLHVDIVDQSRELQIAQEELSLQQALMEKTRELATRLRERGLLFDVVKLSLGNQELHEVLSQLAQRLHTALRLREVAILLKEDARFVIQASHGFAEENEVVGRSVEAGEGVAGEVAVTKRTIVIPDVKMDPDYMSFWDKAKRQGGFAAIPIVDQDELIGLLALTRQEVREYSRTEVKLFRAVGDQVALVIRQARLVDELRDLSTHDELTGLANRRLLTQRFDREILRAGRYDQAISVISIDVDHFKKLNDRCGHAAGDRGLINVAKVVEANVRRLDTVARIGGEEFVVLLPRTEKAAAKDTAEKIRKAIEETAFEGGEGQPDGRLTISLGVATYVEGDTPESIIERSDRALYRAKANGRNQVCD